jgi:PAS domain S-box-containing protein
MWILRHITAQLLLLVLSAVLPLSAAIAYLIYSDARQSEALAFERAREIARDIAEDSKAFLERGSEQLNYLAARPAVRALDPSRCDPMIVEVQRMNTIYSVITLTDAQGQTLCLSLTPPSALPSYADREWFQNGMLSKGFRVGVPVIGRLTGTAVAPLTVPVLDAEGTVAGVLMFPASLSRITGLVEKSVRMPLGSLVTVVSHDGTIIARSPDSDHSLGKDGRQIPALAHQMERREGVDTFRDADGMPRLTAFTTMPGIEWLVSAGIPVEVAAMRQRDQLRRSLIILAAVLPSVLLLTLYGARMIRRPIRSLASVARSVSQGELGVRAPETGPVEIAEVAREFNRMLTIRTEAEVALRQRNAELRESEARFRAIASHSPDHLLVQDQALRYVFVMNPQLGLTEQDMLGKTDHDFLSKDDADKLTAIKRQVLEGAQPVHLETTLLSRTGEQQWFDGTFVPRLGDDGQIDGLIGYFRNITERKRTDAEIQRHTEALRQRTVELDAVNKELDAFSYSASHDLRAPLQTIDGFSRALLEDCGEKLDPDAQDYLRRIRRAVQLMAQLVDDLLKLSRLTRADMHPGTVDLGGIARSVADRLREQDPAREVDFDIAADHTVHGDARLLAVLVENLLGNAWKFTSRHAQAKIEVGVAEHEGERVHFVRDDGAGFDMAQMDKLFIPFQRLHATSDFPGTGIGLALARRIVLRHGGRIWAEGAQEKGATFYFTLPSAPAGAPGSA